MEDRAKRNVGEIQKEEVGSGLESCNTLSPATLSKGHKHIQPRHQGVLPDALAKTQSSSFLPVYSGSVGLLNNTDRSMLPWPSCEKLGALGSPGSRFDSVSDGPNRTNDYRNSITSG